MKTYVITLSRVFPAKHPKKGRRTQFYLKFIDGQSKYDTPHWKKVHTIRANYELWRKRFEKINSGEACLSVREWTGKPFWSPQRDIARLTREDGIGLQHCWMYNNSIFIDGHPIEKETVAWRDGLSLEDWEAWFKDYDKSKALAVIQFTKFRY